jgi:excisionase family DNA binding protein
MTVHFGRGERFITADEIAYRTGWHLMTVYRKAKSGQIPGVTRLGNSLRFKWSEVEAWLEMKTAKDDKMKRKSNDFHP